MSRIFVKTLCNSFLKNFNFVFNSNLLYYDYFFYLNIFSSFLLNINFYKINFFFLKNFKNFFSAFYLFLKNYKKFLCFDSNYKFNFFKNLLFSEVESIRYNFLITNSPFFLKNQIMIYNYNILVKELKIKFLIIIDYNYYFNFLSYFNTLNLSIFSVVPYNYNFEYIDYYLLSFKEIFFFTRILTYSYILYLHNLHFLELNQKSKKQFITFYFKNYYLTKQKTNHLPTN